MHINPVLQVYGRWFPRVDANRVLRMVTQPIYRVARVLGG
jgi:hypothetical protein